MDSRKCLRRFGVPLLVLPVPALAAPANANPGDTAWMIVATLLVLLMTLPGLALFYGGLVRGKSALNTMLMSVAALGVVTVQWVLGGYSLAFAGGGGGVGG